MSYSVIGGLCALACLIVAYAFRMLQRRVKEETCRGLCRGIAVGAVVGMAIFVLTYLSMWDNPNIVFGQGASDGLRMMRFLYVKACDALDQFAAKQGHYPESLEELPQLKDRWPSDPWLRPYRYTKTEKGYRIYSLGRDDKPGGDYLDADIEPDRRGRVTIAMSVSQFLFEGKGSFALFVIASIGGVCAALACVVASIPTRKETAAAWLTILLSGVGAFLMAMLVVFTLVAVYIAGGSH
jgi:hypothetical protein